MALLLLRNDHNYVPWLDALKEAEPELQVYTPDTLENKDDISYILSWKAPHGSFEGYPNLKVVGSMGAGVDHLFEDPSLPEDISITRIVDNHLKGDMQEFVLALALNHCKNLTTYVHQQQNATWEPIPYKRASQVTVGIMGLGVLGAAVARLLHKAGFKLSGWANSKKDIDGLTSYAGQDELNSFLSTAEILVCLLPLTSETEGILNRKLFKELPEQAYIINVARGGHLVDEDLLAQLESGHLSGAALDVFHEEPLPKEHPFWGNKKILITPHTASKSDPSSIADQIADNYKRMERGESLENTVSHDQRY